MAIINRLVKGCVCLRTVGIRTETRVNRLTILRFEKEKRVHFLFSRNVLDFVRLTLILHFKLHFEAHSVHFQVFPMVLDHVLGELDSSSEQWTLLVVANVAFLIVFLQVATTSLLVLGWLWG